MFSAKSNRFSLLSQCLMSHLSQIFSVYVNLRIAVVLLEVLGASASFKPTHGFPLRRSVVLPSNVSCIHVGQGRSIVYMRFAPLKVLSGLKGFRPVQLGYFYPYIICYPKPASVFSEYFSCRS